jgi:hypothetical protein
MAPISTATAPYSTIARRDAASDTGGGLHQISVNLNGRLLASS